MRASGPATRQSASDRPGPDRYKSNRGVARNCPGRSRRNRGPDLPALVISGVAINMTAPCHPITLPGAFSEFRSVVFTCFELTPRTSYCSAGRAGDGRTKKGQKRLSGKPPAEPALSGVSAQRERGTTPPLDGIRAHPHCQTVNFQVDLLIYNPNLFFHTFPSRYF